ncbi:protein TolQ [Salinisphaera sp. USBA-960]|uniref:protein TolQ n=1 Tax=Salinisphaera orenii TaxID=856731 RepID=UPI000DBE9B23|nr:protein TolQ [Salifodinibacter halophilus]NNC25989.1 protein TolQ [Salifodinibacter halophilus]
MEVATDFSVWGLIVQASVFVKLILLILLTASVASWVVIFSKRRTIKLAIDEMEDFEDRFWTGGNIKDIYAETMAENDQPQGMSALFKVGYEQLSRQRNAQDVLPADIVSSVQRAMRVTLSREMQRFESGVAMLATVGSVSPYVGLFGTVWGIISAFNGLSEMERASLSMVAPGISEALVATAMGLFAAIPAVVAYNYLTNRLEYLENRLETFTEEMTGIVERGLNVQRTRE